jgi:phenylacetate-CoA ligase
MVSAVNQKVVPLQAQKSNSEYVSRDELRAIQEQKFKALLQQLQAQNRFYQQQLQFADLQFDDFNSLENLPAFPFTTKKQLLDDQAEHPPFGSNLTCSLDQYTRYHQTSGTTGAPLKVLDTEASWQWWGKCWSTVLRAAGLTAADRLFAAFGFGPFIGFWGAVEGARQLGVLMVPGGGQNSRQRLQLIKESGCTAICCTPTYALRLAEVAQEIGLNLGQLPVKLTIHAGEPGASVPATRSRIENSWNARCIDHAGASEIGAHSFACWQQPGGTHINELEFIAEVIDPDSGRAVAAGEAGELVLTNLGRIGFPVIRYRTGDIVKLDLSACDCGRHFVRCAGGIIGRRDDMMTVRGVNVYPSAIENLIRQAPGVSEFRCIVSRQGVLDKLEIEFETTDDEKITASFIKQHIQEKLGLTPKITCLAANSLPRFELKAKRFIDRRS